MCFFCCVLGFSLLEGCGRRTEIKGREQEYIGQTTEEKLVSGFAREGVCFEDLHFVLDHLRSLFQFYIYLCTSLQYVTFSTADGALEAAPAGPWKNYLETYISLSEVSRNHLYGAGSNAVHFIVKSSRAATKLASYCLDHKQQLMRKVEDAISRVFVAFDEYMRRLFELR